MDLSNGPLKHGQVSNCYREASVVKTVVYLGVLSDVLALNDSQDAKPQGKIDMEVLYGRLNNRDLVTALLQFSYPLERRSGKSFRTMLIFFATLMHAIAGILSGISIRCSTLWLQMYYEV